MHLEVDRGFHLDASIELGRGYGQYDPSKHFHEREPLRHRGRFFRKTTGSTPPLLIQIIMHSSSARTGLGTGPAVALCCLLIHLHPRDGKLFEEKNTLERPRC